MTEINREFLVPYLRDVCALHFAKRKLTNKIYNLNQKIDTFQSGRYNPVPVEPKNSSERGHVWPWVLLAIVSIFLLFCFIRWSLSISNVFSFDESWRLMFKPFRLGWMIVVVCLASCSIIAFIYAKFTCRDNKNLKEKYQHDLIEYRKMEKLNQVEKQQIPTLQSDVRRYSSELRKIDGLLQKAYGVNIIPRQYRDIYAAVYLYDWFSTSRAVDLDMALNMFVLEQIKDKLDTIIRNQSDILLNQCIMIANQQKAMVQQQRDNFVMRSKLESIIASNEERNMYLGMIESHTATTAFLATVNYINEL